MLKHSIFLLLSFVLFISCATNQPTETKQSATDTLQAQTPAETVDDRPAAVIDTVLVDKDTLFNMLAKMNAVHGDFLSVTSITENFLDAGNPESERTLHAFLIESGAGEYIGPHDDVPYETIYDVLVVLEDVDGELRYITHAQVAEASNARLYRSSTEVGPVSLTEEKDGVFVYLNSSEEGAGDYGFRRKKAELYVLLNGSIESIFEETLDDFEFASNETDSYAERTTTVELTFLETKTNGLYDIQTTTTTSENASSEDEETEEDQSGQNESETESDVPAGDEESEAPADVDDGIVVYKWTGSVYKIEGN